MFLAAALIELEVPDAGTLKAHRSLANALKDRIRRRFNVSVAEVGDAEDRRSLVIGCAAVGVDPRHMREKMERLTRFVEGLGLAEVVGDDVVIARLDELEEVDEVEEADEQREADE